MTKAKATPKRKRRSKKEIEAANYRRMVKATIKAQADFRAKETADHMESIAEFIEQRGGYVAEGLKQARRTVAR